jgi:hypothetical protein
MPVKLIATDDWRPLIMMEHWLWDLEREGLLHPVTSSTQREWIAPPVEHQEPSLPKGYMVSFIKFHHRGLGSPLSCFMRALLHHYGVELQHFSPTRSPPRQSSPWCVKVTWG